MENVLTVDVEDWHQAILTIPPKNWGRYESRIEKSAHELLDILAQAGARATFFILGQVASTHPDLIRRIQGEGHEIGSHGYCHRPIYEQTKQEFREDLDKSIKVLEDTVGVQIITYRAPWFSITRQSFWALDILSEQGIRYDASIFPVKTNFYGISNAPRYPYIIEGKHGPVLEIPPATCKIGQVVLPIGGGFYLRTVPYQLIRRGIERINRKNMPAVMYIHPWELDVEQPRLRLDLMQSLIHYTNIRGTKSRFRRLLSDFQFAPIGEILPLPSGNA